MADRQQQMDQVFMIGRSSVCRQFSQSRILRISQRLQ